LNEKWHTKVPKEWRLAFLPLDSKEGQMYFAEMRYCVDFALASRKLMMERTKECFLEVFPDVIFDITLNIAHNYAAKEHHYGKNVVIHRKGATLAREGVIGIIPGSQGTNSYIVEGFGNRDSFASCSHGAGRKMSRTRAKKELDLDVEKKFMDKQNIIHGLRNQSDLDEASGAYKNINDVMYAQRDLVEIHVKLQPLAVMKG
jgi:tRNA-splicing ligase RtcB (3'-phosphate/5'-hydroxy nucleic acid ligase)